MKSADRRAAAASEIRDRRLRRQPQLKLERLPIISSTSSPPNSCARRLTRSPPIVRRNWSATGKASTTLSRRPRASGEHAERDNPNCPIRVEQEPDERSRYAWNTLPKHSSPPSPERATVTSAGQGEREGAPGSAIRQRGSYPKPGAVPGNSSSGFCRVMETLGVIRTEVLRHLCGIGCLVESALAGPIVNVRTGRVD